MEVESSKIPIAIIIDSVALAENTQKTRKRTSRF